MHLTHLTYWTSQLSLAHLKCAQNVYISLQWGNYLEFHLKSNCLPLFITRNRRHRWSFCRHHRIWIHKIQYPEHASNSALESIGCLLLWSHVWQGSETPCHCPASEECLLLHIARPGKDQNQSMVSTKGIFLLHHCKVKKL